VLHAARWKYKTPRIRHLRSIAQCCQAISLQLRHVSTIGKNVLNINISPTCTYNMVNFDPLAAEIISLVWGIPANFNGFCVLAPLLHGTLVVGVSPTFWRWTEGATYTWQGGRHIGHLPTFVWATKLVWKIRGKIIRTLLCVRQLCTLIHTQVWAVIKVDWCF